MLIYVFGHGGDLDGFHHWDSGWGLVMVLAMVLFWAAVIGLVAWVVVGARRQGGGTEGGRSAPTALETLDRRFAEGAISTEEYAERRRFLREAGAPDWGTSPQEDR